MATKRDDDSITAARAPRQIECYDLPDMPEADSPTFGVIKTIGLKMLTPLEEKTAARRANGDQIRLAYELAFESLAEINGKVLKTSDGSADKAWGEMHAKVRNLVMLAYSELAAPDEAISTSFLKSRKSKV